MSGPVRAFLIALAVSLAQRVHLAAAFAGFARRQMAGRQFAWAMAASIGWWALCRVVPGWPTITPNLGTHL